MNTQPIPKLNIAISVLAIFLFTGVVAAQDVQSDKPLTSKEWVEGFGNGFNIRHSTGPDQKWKIYLDGPDSPFIQLLDEMKTYGFTGLDIGIKMREYPNQKINEKTSGYFPTTYNEELGKWRQDEAAIVDAKARVDAALERGYYVMFSPPRLGYGDFDSNLKAEKMGWTHEDRLTDTHLKREIDVLEQYAVAFKDYSPRLALVLIGEVHMWQYETRELSPDHPDYMTNEEYWTKYHQFLEDKTVAARAGSPTRIIFYGASGFGNLIKLPFPFADEAEPTDDEVYYGIFQKAYGDGPGDWNYWDVDNLNQLEALKSRLFSKQLKAVRDFSASNNIGFFLRNWNSVYGEEFKPTKDSAAPDYKHSTDYQSFMKADSITDLFESLNVTFEYSDARMEDSIYDAETQSLSTAPHYDMLFRALLDKRDERRIRFQAVGGGEIDHPLGEPHKGINMARAGTTIQIEALPDPGYVFVGWTGHIKSLENPIEFIVPKDHGIIRANFAPEGSPVGVSEQPTELVRHWEVNEVKEYTYVSSSQPDQNFDSETNMLVNIYGSLQSDGETKHAYLKFEVNNVPDDVNKIASAALKFTKHENEVEKGLATLSLHAVDPYWYSDTLTWNSMPEDGELVDTMNFKTRSAKNVHFDITDLVKAHGNGIYSVKISGTPIHMNDPRNEGDMLIYSSKEHNNYLSENKPLLYVI